MKLRHWRSCLFGVSAAVAVLIVSASLLAQGQLTVIISGGFNAAYREALPDFEKTTGIKGSQSNQPGGLNKVARNISKASKKAGSDAKAEKNRAKSNVHGDLTEAGKSVKDTTLKGKP